MRHPTPPRWTVPNLPVLAFLLGLLALPAPASQITVADLPRIDPEVRKAELELEIIRHLLQEAVREDREFARNLEGVVSLASVSKRIQKPYDELLPTKDPWGNAYLLIVDPFLMVSAGPDGTPDISYEDAEESEDGGSFPRGLVDDIVADSHTVISGSRRAHWLQKQTMANMRSIGISIEAFAIDSNVYPGPTGGVVVVDWVAPDISPTFIRKVPSKDGWGEPIYFWSNGTDYFLISFGADKTPEQPYRSMLRPTEELSGAGPTSDPDRDIIYSNGEFVQWPERDR